jgi:hypothetical protein
MGLHGDAYDVNAVCEAFLKTLKHELVDRRSWPTKAEARLAVVEFIECFYNRRRRHSTLGYRSYTETLIPAGPLLAPAATAFAFRDWADESRSFRLVNVSFERATDSPFWWS